MQIETSRMYIRNFIPKDVQDLHEILGDSETMEKCEPAYTLEKTQAFLNQFCVEKKGALAAVLKQTEKVIGYILFKPWGENVYEIGWIFHKDYWRQGYAYESCRAVMQYGFSDRNLQKIVAETIDNEKSLGLMKKLGMKCEEVRRSQAQNKEGKEADLHVYAVHQEEFLSKEREQTTEPL